MIAETIPALEALDPNQRLLLANELLESVWASDIEVKASDALLIELEKRNRDYQADPTQVTSWEDAKKRIQASRS